jgi:hypothetical protein
MITTTSESAIRKHFPAFARKLKDKAVCVVKPRLIAGAQRYGDVSFHRTLRELFSEIELEFIDIPGWSFIAWCRLLSIRLLTSGDERKRVAGYMRELEDISRESLALYRRMETLRAEVSAWETQIKEESCPQK